MTEKIPIKMTVRFLTCVTLWLFLGCQAPAPPPAAEASVLDAGETVGALNDSCDDRHPCRGGLRCESQRCVGTTAEKCSADSDCSQQLALLCRPKQAMAAEQFCQSAGAPGEPCSEDPDCQTGRCGPGTSLCANLLGASCHGDADCLAPGICRIDVKTGKRSCQVPGTGNDFCDDDNDCADGRSCEVGFCQMRSLEPGCLNDSACPTGHRCSQLAATSALRSCRPPTSVAGSFCENDSGCARPLRCLGSSCLALTDAGCTSSDTCATGLVCRRGQCKAPAGVGEACEDLSGQPQDALCEAGLLCAGEKRVCSAPASLLDGEPCARDIECGTHAAGVKMICHGRLRRCAVPGPVLADVVFSDVIVLSSPEDTWTSWQCFEFPKVKTPPGYKRWNYVDSPTHKNNGEDVPGIRIAYSDDETRVCVSIRGAEDPPPWRFWESKRPTELSFRLNAVSYNSSLMLVKTRIPPRASDCSDSFSGIDNPNSQPCMTAGEYWHPMSVPAGFAGIGLVEPVLYEDRGSYASFVSIVIGVSELKPIVSGWRGYDIDRYMLFATATNYLCGGYVGLRYHGVFWRDGLDVRARSLTSTVSETTPEGGATHDWEAPGDGVTTYLTFLNLRSLNLNAEVIKEDMFWKYCGSMSDGLVTCSPKKPAENPLPDPLEDGLTKAADAGAVKLCKSFLPVGELCDAAGKGAGWLAQKILDLLFIHGECVDDAGKDKDLEFLMSKSVDERGSNFHFEARSGDGRLHPGTDPGSPHATISAQLLQLGFKE